MSEKIVQFSEEIIKNYSKETVVNCKHESGVQDGWQIGDTKNRTGNGAKRLWSLWGSIVPNTQILA